MSVLQEGGTSFVPAEAALIVKATVDILQKTPVDFTPEETDQIIAALQTNGLSQAIVALAELPTGELKTLIDVQQRSLDY